MVNTKMSRAAYGKLRGLSRRLEPREDPAASEVTELTILDLEYLFGISDYSEAVKASLSFSTKYAARQDFIQFSDKRSK